MEKVINERGINRSKELTMEVIVGTFVFMALLVLSMFTIVLSSENIFRLAPALKQFSLMYGVKQRR